MRIGILAGEASGDLLGAKLIQALRAEIPHLQVEGVGGPLMMSMGCQSLFDIEELAVMGFVEPLLRLPRLIRLRHQMCQHFLNNRPDVFIGIDAPDFNLGLELKLRRAGIPVIHYVSPSVWAWRQRRVFKIKKAVDLMLTLLPFEKTFYEKYQVPVKYVGHPLADQIPLEPDTQQARRALCIDEHSQYIALLPGSRKQELKMMVEPLLRAAEKILQQYPHIKFITSHVNEERYQEFYDCYQQLSPHLPLQFFTRRSQDVITACDMAIVTSGTVTLETMLCKKPMVICYRMSKITYHLAKYLVKTRFVGLPNLLANELLVPELIQDAVTPQNISASLFEYLAHPHKVALLKNKFLSLHQQLKIPNDIDLKNIIKNIAFASD